MLDSLFYSGFVHEFSAMNGAMDQASAQHAQMMAAAHLQGGHLMPTPPPPGTAAGAAAASAQQAAQAAAAQQQLLSHAGGVTIVYFCVNFSMHSCYNDALRAFFRTQPNPRIYPRSKVYLASLKASWHLEKQNL